MSGDRIVAIGGPTKNRLWMQSKADVTGVVVEVPDVDEAVPLGAAILAGIGTCVYRDEQEAYGRVYRPGTSYVPDSAAHQRYRELYEQFEALYPAIRAFVEKSSPRSERHPEGMPAISPGSRSGPGDSIAARAPDPEGVAAANRCDPFGVNSS